MPVKQTRAARPEISVTGPVTSPLAEARRRLEAACRLARAACAGVGFRLVDVTAVPAGDDPLLRKHGLDGPQSYRVHVRGHAVTLLGHGALGVAYAVERFRRDVLGLDPLAFWTGLPVQPVSALPETFDQSVPAPCFEHRLLFENDADELIHASGQRLQLEWPYWREMIDTAVALGYSGIVPFDSLGRSEFVEWDYYRSRARFALVPRLIRRVIDYAHARGLVVGVHLAPSWAFRRLPADKACWSRYGEDWKAILRHYLTRTPLRHADLFGIGGGDPLWDGDVRCRCEACARRGTAGLREDIVKALATLVAEVVPGRVIFHGLYNVEGGKVGQAVEGMVAEYSDYGCAEFRELPAVPTGVPTAVYLHAGYWLDHVVMNPYLEQIGRAVRAMRERGATRWIRVNGQSFRPFLLTIEALSEAAWAPASFDAAAFAKRWIARRLGPQAGDAFLGFVEALRLAHESTRTQGLARGYVKLLLGHIYPLFHELAGRQPDEPVYFDPHRERDTTRILASFPDLGSTAAHAAAVRAATTQALAAAQALGRFGGTAAQAAFIDDLAVFPARLFAAAAGLYEALVAVRDAPAGAMSGRLAALTAATHELWDLHLQGPAHPLWRDWYLPDRIRIFGTPPRPELALWVARALAQ